jgi:hypothetical protein
MKSRPLILLVAAGISFWLGSSNPRSSVAGEAPESFQEAEVWLGGQLVNRPQQPSPPPPQPLAEDDRAATQTAAGIPDEETMVRQLGPSPDVAGPPATARAAGTAPRSEPNATIATALDECLRQNRVLPMKPPRPLREQVSPPAPATRRRAPKAMSGDSSELREGRSVPGKTYEQVSYVTRQVQPSAAPAQAEDVPEDELAEEPILPEPPPSKARSAAPSPPQQPPRLDAAEATPAPSAASANQLPQSSLTQLLALLGIVALVLVAQRRLGAAPAPCGSTPAPAAPPAAALLDPSIARPLVDSQARPSSDLSNELENGLVAAAVAWNVKLRKQHNEALAAAVGTDNRMKNPYP